MAPVTIQQAFDLALQHHQAGRLLEAERLYRQILAQSPDHVGAMHYSGVIAHQAGRSDIAVELIRRALILRPNYAEAYSNLGIALKEIGQLDQAIAACRQAIALRPNYVEAYTNLGDALRDIGLADEAIAAARQAISLNPKLTEAYNTLGNALHDTSLMEEAVAAYQQAIALRPNYPEAYSNLGNTLNETGKLDEAVTACRRAIALRPNYAQAYNNLGSALKLKGQLKESIAAYHQAIASKPNYPEAFANLGNVLVDDEQSEEAIAAYRNAIALKPDYAEAYNNLGNVLGDVGQPDEAIKAYRQAMVLKPKGTKAHSNLIHSFYYHPGYSAKAIADEQRNWNRQHAEPLKEFIQPHFNDRSPDRRLRIGYVSSDLRNHPVGRFMLPLLAHHDPSQVEVFAYSQSPVADAITERLRASTHCWRSIVGLSDAQAADLIRRDQIDILVDLTMHTSDNRLLVFARKPAPVQVTWLGYPGSTGLTAIDYRLSDPYLDPPGMYESIYSEQMIRLPGCFWCYDPVDGKDIPINPLPALTSSIITFGCLSKFAKINPPLLALWAKVLLQVKDSRLLLLANPGRHIQQTADQLSQHEINAERLEFIPRQPHQKYLEQYRRIDLGLDSLPYNGHTTSLDGLWMGVPMVTLAGQTAVGRAGSSILSNIGLLELIAHSEEEYVEIAVHLAKDLPRLSNLRSTLRQRMEQSPLMDAPKFARNIEAAYRQMWRTWCPTVSTKS